MTTDKELFRNAGLSRKIKWTCGIPFAWSKVPDDSGMGGSISTPPVPFILQEDILTLLRRNEEELKESKEAYIYWSKECEKFVNKYHDLKQQLTKLKEEKK